MIPWIQKSGPAILLLVTLLTTAPAGAGPDEEALETRGAEALKPLKQQLMSALVQALQEGGPGEAITVCSEQASTIAARVATPGVTLGRTSHQLRNPENAPEKWMEPVLEKYAGNPKSSEPSLVALEDGGHGYAEPIFIRSACLKCHGTTLAPGVAEKLAALYPEDKATGFAEGDFRGIFWVRLDPSGPVTTEQD